MSDESPHSPDRPPADAQADGGASGSAQSVDDPATAAASEAADPSQDEQSSASEPLDDESATSESLADAARTRVADRDSLVPFPSTDKALGALVVFAVLGLAARLVWIGQRVAHQDEGRVAYWIIRYLESGVWEYRPIVHGPFLFHVNKWVFEFLGPSDFTSRLVPAILGASMPLAAWLYRKHLRDTEVVALGLLFAFNPVLLYYSRFMREDIPLVVFTAFALGFFLRYADDRKRWHLAAGVGVFALAMTTKENVLLYPVCWLGAAALLLDHRLFRAPARGESVLTVLVDYLDWLAPFDVRGSWSELRRANGGALVDRHLAWWGGNWQSVGFAFSLVVEFVAIIVLFYAPRGGGFTEEGVAGWPGPEQAGMDIGLWNAIGSADVGMFGAIVWESLVGSWEEFMGTWGGGHGNPFLQFFEHYVTVMIDGALVVLLFAIVGFIVDRYSNRGPRDFVALCSYWGFVSILGYPIATDIRAGWATTHAIFPLAIPAAVGLAIVFRWGVDAFTDDDAVGVALSAVVVLVVLMFIAVPAGNLVYSEPQSPDNSLVQYAQSSSTDLKPTLADVERVGYQHGGIDETDVMFYGNGYYVSNESENLQPNAGGGYFDRRTLMWYMEMYQHRALDDPDAAFNYDSTLSLTELNESKPPVIIAIGNGSNGDDADEIHDWALENGYEAREFQRFLTTNRTDEGLGPGTPFIIYIDEDALAESGSNSSDRSAESVVAGFESGRDVASVRAPVEPAARAVV
ncbi:flippase activity-associated protein Agl23 [Haloarchaeobius sp. HME9146]|uniref:flippase activity-associated protein Agl23 n=1 Tax=Haloarchaeobius sp. HME9146 TaxID=2978732 RepID=UPI0021C1CB14|nr:flippase activity-associated protein Agl23 [Haloarchaeobius sp. HME9146]MCT9094500.1 TIGR03663 family protein [Haloarchaeobius sp. HME9146]